MPNALLDDVPGLGPYPNRQPRNSLRDFLENLSIGLGHGISNNLEGLSQLLTDPYAGTEMLEGLYQAASHPRQTANALGQYAKQAVGSPLNAGFAIGQMLDPSMARSLGKFGKPVMSEMTAYHGSPHKFDKFELSDKTIGTGEGAQAYGHGLYFAEDPKVAGSYRASTSRPEYTIGGRLYKSDQQGVLRDDAGRTTGGLSQDLHDAATALYGSKPDQSLATLAEEAESFLQTRTGMTPARIQAAKQAILDGRVKLENRGSLYHVDIPDEQINKMLDWDKPLGEQPEALSKIRQLQKLPEFKHNSDLKDALQHFELGATTGQTIQGILSRYFQGDNAKVSGLLNRLGIPGIRYLDAGSRSTGKGTRNFVVFDDSIVKVLKRE